MSNAILNERIRQELLAVLSKGVDVPCEMYGWDVVVTRRRVTVVSRTLNKTRENQKEKPLA